MKKILSMCDLFQDYNQMSNICYFQQGDNGNVKDRGLRQIKKGEIAINQIYNESEIEELESNHEFNISINNHMASYLSKKVSPIVKANNSDNEKEDQNRLYLALAFMRVYFEDEDAYTYFPLILTDITDQKGEIYSKAKQTGLAELKINFSKDIFLNEEVVSFFYDIESEFNGNSVADYMSTNLEDFIPDDYKGSLEEVIQMIYSEFKDHAKTDFKIDYPMVTSDKSSVFMFFNSKSEFKQKKEYSLINEEDKLVKEYLTYAQEENKHSELTDDIFLGTFTRDFPLGEGQSVCMQEYYSRNAEMMAVVGGPGSGKSTLIGSIITSNITKRAIALANGKKDYHNLMLITSTSNKAVDGVAETFKKGFNAFCYVGGNSENIRASKEEVTQVINSLEEEMYSETQLQKSKKSMNNLIKFFEDRKSDFLNIKSHKDLLEKYKIKKSEDFMEYMIQKEDLEKLNIKDLKKSKKEIFNILSELNVLLSEKKSLPSMMEYIEDNLGVLKGSLKKLENMGLLSFMKKKNLLKEVNLNSEEELREVIKLSEELIKLEPKIHKINNFLDQLEDFNKLKILNSFMENDKRKTFFTKTLFSKNFGAYFRTNLYNLNYKLFSASYTYMHQTTLLHKEEVIQALGALAADNMYEYIMENYGRDIENQLSFLRHLSMIYPVMTSTLASVTNQLPGINPSVIKVYDTIIADEAGMIGYQDMIPALRRGKKGVIVGDPKQLKHIISMNQMFLTKFESNYPDSFVSQYSPRNISAFHRAAGTIEGGYMATGRGIILDEHRRCQPQIANLFIDIAQYQGFKVETKHPTSKGFKGINEEGLFFFDVKNQDMSGFSKINHSEINMIEKLLSRVEAAGYDLTKDVGIITPYKDMEVNLINRFGNRLQHSKAEAKIGTVHKFQGVEYKVIIFSTVVSREKNDNLKFINVDPSMINVAVSRTKESFMVVGDYDFLTSTNDFENYAGRMAKYIKKHGKLIKRKA